MPRYVDGFVIAVPKKNLVLYKKIAKKACAIWREYGALDYVECAGDDLVVKGMLSFTKMAKCKPSETVMFSWISYKSKAHRNSVNKMVMKDPRMAKMMSTMAMPFDMKRMAYGGFKAIVEA
jgi:uncharacterized protein YbaA (DUF1428 family)